MATAVQSETSTPSAKARARRQLELATRGWFAATALGQLLFVAFILLFYYTSVLSGDYAAWNAKPHISGLSRAIRPAIASSPGTCWPPP